MDNERRIPEFKAQKSLAAVVFTDGVNFSARMSMNEEQTLEMLQQDLQVMREQCDRFEGRVLKSTGDGLLMCFTSATNAVACALEIQKVITEASALLPPGEALQHRIGIHLGDVYITESDVMGTGVNIAARLQTQADPGGICVSQTVYDVVKSALAFHATYLGPRKLKNIREDIPVYALHNKELGDTWDHADPDEIPEQTVLQPTTFNHPDRQYTQIADELNQHEALVRIKKLLVCLCHQRWENDPKQLDRFPLKDLLKELHQRNGTFAELQANLEQVVRNLSKQAEYRLVAHTIAGKLAPLYPDHAAIPDALFHRIAQTLERDPQTARMKKLLYCACRNVWESDSQRLAQVSMLDLLRELLQIAPTREHLQLALQGVVSTLNKATEYSLVSDIIRYQLEPFYTGQPIQEVAIANPPPILVEDATTMLPPPPVLLNDSTGVLPPPPRRPQANELNDSTGLLASPPAPLPVTPSPVTANSVQDQAGAIRIPLPPPPPGIVRCPPQLFNLRQEIMRYVTPLLAKWVIISALDRPLALDENTLSLLKSQELDLLLRDLFRICTNFANLETRLTRAAEALEDPQQGSQAASAVIQAMKPYYFLQKSIPVGPSSSGGGGQGEERTVSLPFKPLSMDEDATCQFLPTSQATVAPFPSPTSDEETCHFTQPPGA
ncbi:MAG: adenylate/guanylate cyclase domain-containing protein [Leptolyngbyaceae cyanobacterium bins.59]|nr:adenylate/guanylate cyclase domain-containing protein [Leptolyngbyaceae cyanobacterium bins.59]